MANPDGFLMKLVDGSLPSEFWPWATARFRRVRVALLPEVALVGALGFKRPPASLKHFQRLVNNNLTNWGYERSNQFQHGWVKFCTAEEFCEAFSNSTVQARWPRIRARMSKASVASEVKKLKERRRVLKGGSLKRGRPPLVDRIRMQEAFDALTTLLEEKKERLAIKAKQFNRERYGVEQLRNAIYSKKELEWCESWLEVARQRHPAMPWQLAQWAKMDRACREEIQSARLSKPVGLW